MFKRLLSVVVFTVSILGATEPTQESVAKLYIATFNRAPDATGFNYWAQAPLSLEQMASSFFAQPETKAMYPDEYSDEDFIVTVYQNLFDRAPDSGGMDFWLGELQSGRVSRSVFILAALNGASGDDAKFLTYKTVVALAFVNNGRNDIEGANTIMSGVTHDASSVYAVLCNYSLAECQKPELIAAPLP